MNDDGEVTWKLLSWYAIGTMTFNSLIYWLKLQSRSYGGAGEGGRGGSTAWSIHPFDPKAKRTSQT